MRALVLLLVLMPLPAALAEAPQDDCGSGGDAPYALKNGVILAPGTTCAGYYEGSLDERDSYRVEALPGQTLRIEMAPDSGSPVIFLYTPDHGAGRPSWFATFGRDNVTVNVTEPGLWRFYVYVCAPEGPCGSHKTAYNLTVTASGEAWTPDDYAGEILVGHPATTVDRTLGPERALGVDGSWRDLARPTTGVGFAVLDAPECPSCLDVAFTDAEGDSVSGSGACGRMEGRLECALPAGATKLFVSARDGTHVAWTMRLWQP